MAPQARRQRAHGRERPVRPRPLRHGVRLQGRQRPHPRHGRGHRRPRPAPDLLHLPRRLRLEDAGGHGGHRLHALLRGPEAARRALRVLPLGDEPRPHRGQGGRRHDRRHPAGRAQERRPTTRSSRTSTASSAGRASRTGTRSWAATTSRSRGSTSSGTRHAATTTKMLKRGTDFDKVVLGISGGRAADHLQGADRGRQQPRLRAHDQELAHGHDPGLPALDAQDRPRHRLALRAGLDHDRLRRAARHLRRHEPAASVRVLAGGRERGGGGLLLRRHRGQARRHPAERQRARPPERDRLPEERREAHLARRR